jgi:hypothetical protein
MMMSLNRKIQKPYATTVRFGAGPASLGDANASCSRSYVATATFME